MTVDGITSCIAREERGITVGLAAGEDGGRLVVGFAGEDYLSDWVF